MITIVLLLAAVAAIAVLVAVSACKAYNESQREVRRLHGDLAKAMVESKIVEDLLIERACDWLEENIDSYLSSVIASLGYSDYVLDWNFINDFKKAMKGGEEWHQ